MLKPSNPPYCAAGPVQYPVLQYLFGYESLLIYLIALTLLLGLWPCGTPQSYTNVIIADATIGLQGPTKQFLRNFVFLNYFDNQVDLPTYSTAAFLYDSGWSADNVIFRNYDKYETSLTSCRKTHFTVFSYPIYSVFRIVAGTDYDVGTRVSNVSLQNTPHIHAHYIYLP